MKPTEQAVAPVVALSRMWFIAVAVASLGGLAVGPAVAADAPHPHRADDAAEHALAERFAPAVRMVHQAAECGHGDPYQPTDVDTMLGNRSVALRGPWDQNDLIEVAPTAEALSAGLSGYYLDFPGNPLKPRCDYEQWARAATAVSAPTTYAHVTTEPGRDDRLALQYWFFYPFNDYNNKHEGDWEMIQLVFATGDVTQALAQEPLEAGYSQHEGMEVADWDDPKLHLVDGTHPVVQVALGSHANFYDSALYLGTSGEEGFGCDDTRGPSDELRPVVAVIPGDPEVARREFPWIAFEGRWGQREAAFYNGPTGPNAKESWTHPITVQERDGREVSYAVPGGGLFGTSATDFFCTSVSSGSEVVREVANHPDRLLLAIGLCILVAIYVSRRTRWRPDTPVRLARRRAGGQVIRAAGRVYVSRWWLLIGIGSLTIPVSLAVSGLQGLLLAPGLVGSWGGGEEGGLRVTLVALISFLLLGLSVLLVLAATTQALDAIDRETEIGVRSAYGLALARWRPLLGAFLISSALVSLLSVTVVLSPVAVALVVLFALYVPVIAFERTSAIAALRRSATLVRHQVIKTAVILVTSILVAGLVGPILGTVLILVTGAPLPLVNLVAGVTFAFLMPYVGLTVAYLYVDARVREYQVRNDLKGPDALPAEIEPALLRDP
jgi:hypothetical protein